MAAAGFAASPANAQLLQPLSQTLAPVTGVVHATPPLLQGVLTTVGQPVGALVPAVQPATSAALAATGNLMTTIQTAPGQLTGVVNQVTTTTLGVVGQTVAGVSPVLNGVTSTANTIVTGALESPVVGGLLGQTSALTTTILPTAPNVLPAAFAYTPATVNTAVLGYSGAQGFSEIVAAQLAAPPVGEGEREGAARRIRQQALVGLHPELLETDGHDQPVLRGEVLALSPSAESLARASALGFRIKRRSDLADLGMSVVVLRAPARVSAPEALNRLRQADPDGRYDFNHVYADAGSIGASTKAASASREGVRGLVGLIDSGVDIRHPSLKGAQIAQRGFAPGGVSPHAHGLATASLLVGSQGRFRSAAPGAKLFVADVYGNTAAGGSAESLARALAWMAASRVPVVNISLVGPPNATLQAVVEQMVARGYLIVAAVGNDGPAAPPLYPAAYAGVVAVTGVNGRQRVLPEAGRGSHVTFAAPGADMAAAGARGYVTVRGTSFAAPLVAGRLAQRMTGPDPKDAAKAIAYLSSQATDLGEPGVDVVYGRGLVGADLLTPPTEVAARGAISGF